MHAARRRSRLTIKRRTLLGRFSRCCRGCRAPSRRGNLTGKTVSPVFKALITPQREASYEPIRSNTSAPRCTRGSSADRIKYLSRARCSLDSSLFDNASRSCV